MRIALAQIKPYSGELKKNIQLHLEYIEEALNYDADAIFFPELSLTGYEPLFADELAISKDHPQLEIFQKIADEKKISIGVGFPEKTKTLPKISMAFFSPKKEKTVYSKQLLHEDEKDFFSPGFGYKLLAEKGFHILPAINYESLQDEFYTPFLKTHKADLVVASVAKSKLGIEEAYRIYPKIAEKYEIPILMVNSVGFCDNFESAGISWMVSREGKMISFLEQNRAGILIHDTENPKTEKLYF